MEQIVIHLDNPNLLLKRYKLRKTGAYGRSIETTIPQDAFDREARRLGLTRDEAMDLLQVVWRYGDFSGIYLSFELVEEAGDDKKID